LLLEGNVEGDATVEAIEYVPVVVIVEVVVFPKRVPSVDAGKET
jgi:hypothetical protein